VTGAITDPRPIEPAPEAPPDPRDELLPRLLTAARAIPAGELAALTWIAEHLAVDGLETSRWRDYKGRGADVRDLEGKAVVTAANAIRTIFALLGFSPPLKGMPVREVP
jgi:hypothetical protein